MYEIFSIGGQVLYVAKDAMDVRAALVEAVQAGANLNKAYLGGAYLSGATWEQVAAKLEESLQAMNDGGRHWIKGQLQSTRSDDGSTTYCSVGAINTHSEGTIRAVALWLLQSVTAGGIESFNDHPDTTWEDIQAVFSIATKHARRFATESL